MWNYEFMFPSVMTFLVMLFSYFWRPHPLIRLNQTFVRLMFSNFMTFLLDLLSSWMDENHTSFPPFLLWLVNGLFFMFFLSRIFYFFRFTIDAIRLYPISSRFMIWCSRLIFILSETMVLLSFLTGSVFSIDAEGYHRGPLYDILYVCAFFYIFYALAMVFRHRRKLTRFEKTGLICYQLLLAAGYIVRILLPHHLIMDTFSTLAILVIYLMFENPDLYLSDRGAFNTRALRDVLLESSRNPSSRLLAFVIRDYNDQRSISGGEQMDRGIILINQYLKKLRPRDQVFYLRSGCFAIFSRENMDPQLVSEEIRQRFREPWAEENVHLYLTPAFVTIRPGEQHVSPETIIDTLMIALENAGESSNGTALSEVGALETVTRQIEVKRALENALENNRVEVFLQPIVDNKTGKLAAAEALARIRDEQGRLISPGEFIPIAEKSGHIIELGEQVFRNTCLFVRNFDTESLGIQWINVNLSPVQCTRGDLADRFTLILHQCNVEAARIHLEITEQSMIDYAILQRQMLSLQSQGFLFALDDYGSGYSNLSRVRRFPFSNIKLDMDLVRDYCQNEDPLLPALVSVFHEMGFSITAEGVETQEMAAQLRAIGCDYLQGFVYSQPLSMDDFLDKYGQLA